MTRFFIMSDKNRLKYALLGLFTILSLLPACVSTKKYRLELSEREKCEAREKVLVQEVLDRRKETGNLVKQIGDLNRNLGLQDAELRDLKIELTSRTQQMGESSTKLFSEKSNLEKELAAKKALLGQREALLESVASAQKSRKSILTNLKNSLAKDFPASDGTSLELSLDAVLLTLPDQGLFDKNGTAISVAGQKLLQPLATILSNRPELDVEVQAYTDNALPKGAKGLADTWDWSLARATNVVRTLIRDFNVNGNQLIAVGKGEFYPTTSNETADGRQKNRRTVLVIYPTLPVVPGIEY